VQLLRLATIRLSSPPPTTVSGTPYRASNGVTVTVSQLETPEAVPGAAGPGPTIAWPYEHTQARVMVEVLVDAGAPQVRGDRLLVPPEPRICAEDAISEFADILAVLHQCRRTIRSPNGATVALGPGGTGGDPPSGIHGLLPQVTVRPSARVMPVMEPAALAAATADRSDGLAMLADALFEEAAVGRVRELFRLFERAFARGPSKCIDPLSSFLQSSPRQDASKFDLDEVTAWMHELRPSATHGDRREEYARSADAAPYMARMEAAAYDVLLHKATWHDPSPARRQLINFMSVPGTRNAGSVLLQPGATVMVDWIDPFGIYPIDWERRCTINDPWVWRMPGQT